MKKANKQIAASILAIALCASLVAGGTYALFTSESTVNIAVTSGTVDVVATAGELTLYSKGVQQEGNTFENGGTATKVDNEISIDRMTPMDSVNFDIEIENYSDVSVQYRTVIKSVGDTGLFEALDVTFTENEVSQTFEGGEVCSDWAMLGVGDSDPTTPEDVSTINVNIEFPNGDNQNKYQGKSCKLAVVVEAVQGNAPMVDTWDGTADISWYNEEDTEFELSTAEQLAGLAALVDNDGVAKSAFAEAVTFDGKTLKLTSDVDLYQVDENGNKISFNPIGHSSNGKAFKGVFDGQGHTISNLYEQSDLGAWQYEGEYYGLFAYTDGAEIKNVTVDGAYISSGRNEAAGVVGNAVDTDFSNITISNTTLIAYNNSAGGVASECYGECSFTNITVDEDTVLGPLWGTYDVRLGGVVGMVKSSDKVTFSNITVACKIDAINDVASNYQWYNYRYSGMLIGQVDGVNGVADPTGYVTCENVTVIYDDWMNYHYCEDSSYGTPSYAQAGQYKFNRVEAGTGTDGIDLSTCDHNADESHNVLIEFDQLFGGGQGVSGLKTYDGVTVIYKHKQ